MQFQVIRKKELSLVEFEVGASTIKIAIENMKVREYSQREALNKVSKERDYHYPKKR